MAGGDAEQAFSGSSQPGSKHNIPGDDTLDLLHMAVQALCQAAVTLFR